MTDTIIQLPYGRQAPTLMEIFNRLEVLYENKSLSPILFTCAQELERMLLERMVEVKVKPMVLQRRQTGEGKLRTSHYTCHRCDFEKIRVDEKFCAGCGREISWKE